MVRYGYLLPTRGIVLSSDGASTLSSKANAEVIGLARRAESLGLADVWVGDSVLAKPRLDPLTTLSAVAAATEAVELGTAVHLPPLRNPVTLAQRTATLDLLSGGRFVFGVGVGIGPDVEAEFANLGVEFDQRGRRLDETLDVLHALWTGDEVDYGGGEFVDLSAAGIGFSPVREPPIYVASAGFDPAEGFPRRIRERIVAHGDGWLPIGQSPDRYAAGLDRVRSMLSEAGRDPDGIEAAMYLDVVVDDERAALDEARAFHDQYYPGRETPSDEWLRSSGAFGPPAVIAEELAAYKEAGVERMVVRFPASDQRGQLRRFADIVA